MSAETTAVKRARSESVNSSTPDSKRPNLVAEDVKMDDAANGGPSGSSTSTTLAPPPPSAGLPETPVAAAQAAESIPKPPPSMTIRALIVTQDASIIIGKSGAHIREIREKAGAKVAVTEAIPNNPERVLVVSGPLDAVSKAYGLVVRRINDEPYDSPSVPGSRAVTVRFIIPNARMGSVIGKGGSKIKEIQEASGARLQASEAMLPGSSERILTVSGVADAIHIAVYYVGTILQENGEKQYENRPYRPGYRDAYSSRDTYERDGRDAGSYRPGGSSRGDDDRRGAGDRSATADRPRGPGSYQSTADQPGSQTQQMFIPDDLVAAIIGKGGNKINEVRQKSATNIKIMEPNEEPQKNAAEGDRLVTISGLPENIQIAIAMLTQRLAEEKQKKMEGR